ncbi:hypothetical protein WI88_21665 [Burkholderia ubonensis]|nr:hypothetical protein WI88_21665 [Burkholderia ubonensis]
MLSCSVSDSRRRVANDLFNRLTHKNADRFPRRVTTFILLILQEAKLRYARIEASDHFIPHTAGFA